MAKTLGTIIAELLNRLGDTAETTWTRAEIKRYVKEGYDRLTAMTGCLWDMAYTDDVAGTGTYTLPANLNEIERVTNDSKRIDPVASREVETLDPRYEITQGPPQVYLRDKDGLDKIRLTPVPAQAAASYTVTGSWGILRTPADISSETVTGTWGIPRRIPGHYPMGPGPHWGLPRRAFRDGTNTRIEYRKRGSELVNEASAFEIPDRYVKYVRHYAMARALEREGDGQDSAMAEHYDARFLAGVARMIKRRDAVQSQRTRALGGVPRRIAAPPRARMPYDWGGGDPLGRN